jgi:ACS family hexuronate transporter-like MFS transporter
MRWIAIGIFILSSFLNYLDRQLLSAAAPLIKQEFSLNNEQFGHILLVFSITYGVSALFVGWWLDRVGLNRGIMIAVAAWSLVGVATGFASTFVMLLICRAALGLAEAGSIPAFGKANATYLKPSELALGTGLNQLGLSVAGMAAPFLIGRYAADFGWRSIYIGAGAIGLLWLPMWWITSRSIPATNAQPQTKAQASATTNDLLRDKRFWGLVIGNVLSMTMYTLWTNWTTIYFVTVHKMSQAEANTEFAWIPPVFATLGGLTGGALAFRLIGKGTPVFRSRMIVSWLSSVILLSTAAIPWMPTAAWATVLICASFFWVTAMSANVYAMPIDFFGAQRAGFGVAALTAAYGLMQAVISPAIGSAIDKVGFTPVCIGLSVFPLAACAVLQWSNRDA